MFPFLIIFADLVILISLLSKNLRWGVYWVTFTLPFYELGRLPIAGASTTIVELNIVVLFLWWLISHITYHVSRNKENTKTPASTRPASTQNWGEQGGQKHKNTYVIPDVIGNPENKNKQKKNSFGFLFSFWIPAFAGMTKKALDGWFWFVTAWLAIATFSMIISPSLREAAGVWRAFFVEPILFLVVFVDVMRYPSVRAQNLVPLQLRNIKNVFNVLIASGVVVAVVGIIQKFTGWGIPNEFWAAEATRRVTSVFPFPNAVGLFLAPIAVVTLAMLASKLPTTFTKFSQQSTVNSQQKFSLLIVNCLLLTAFSLMLLAIVFARSRGALLGITFGILFLALFHRGRRVWYWLGIIGVTLAITLTPLKTQLRTLIQSNPASFSGGDSIAIRLEQWKESFSFLKNHPITGAGLAGFQKAIAPYHANPAIEIYKFPHNVFLNLWTELGLAGLALFIMILVLFYKSCYSTMKQLNNQTINGDEWLRGFMVSLLSAFTTLLAHGLVDVPYFKNDLSVLFWILIGISIIIQKSTDVSPGYGTPTAPQKSV